MLEWSVSKSGRALELVVPPLSPPQPPPASLVPRVLPNAIPSSLPAALTSLHLSSLALAGLGFSTPTLILSVFIVFGCPASVSHCVHLFCFHVRIIFFLICFRVYFYLFIYVLIVYILVLHADVIGFHL